MKVAIVSTHPIQYHTPWFRELARQPQVNLKVYYALLPDAQQQGVGFGEAFAWDIPLLEGYDWELIPNKRKSPSLRGFFRSSTPGVYSLLARAQPDVVIITGWQSLPLLQALSACIRLGIPRIIRGESNGARARPVWVRGLHRLLLSRFDGFLAIGKLNRQFYLEYGIPAERIFPAPYFIDNQRFIDQFREDVGEREALRAEWNIEDRGRETGDGGRGTGDGGRGSGDGSTSPVVFLFAGKLEPKKRIMDLLRAMELALGNEGSPVPGPRSPIPSPQSPIPSLQSPIPSPRSPVPSPQSPVSGRPSIHLLVAGAGELMEEARQFAESRRLPVTFAGFLNQTEITRAYAAADCLVLPSDYGETWGLVVNEAMACGLPAIVSDRVGCWPDLVEEGVTGSVFACGDIDALAHKLVDVASDPEKLVRMGEQARQRIQYYSVERAVEGTVRAIEFAARNAGRETGRTGDGRRSPVTGPPSPVTGPPSPDTRPRSPVNGPPSPVTGPRSPRRILHVIPSLSQKDGGPSFALPLIASGLERLGVAVDVVTTFGDEDADLQDVDVDRPVMRDGANYFYFRRQSEFYKASLPLSKWLSAHIRDYDLVHIHALFSYSSYTASRLARKNGVPYVVRPLGVLNRWGMQNRRRLLKRLSFSLIEQRIMRNAAAVHYTSQQEKLEAEQTGVFDHSAVIPLGIDLAAFRTLPGPERFLTRFPHARGREVILFLSRLDPKKGLDLLLRAFAEVARRRETGDGGPKTGDGSPETGLRSPVSGPRSPLSGPRSPVLVIAGDGDDQFVASLRRLAEELGIADDILWAGFLGGEEKLSAMAAASLFVLPSYSENFGIALVEAMAAGLPCVMSDQVGIAPDVKEYDAGLSTACEVEPLASAMNSLLDDPELRCRLGANARRLSEDRFSLEAMSDALVKLYDRILSSGAGESLEANAFGSVVPPLV